MNDIPGDSDAMDSQDGGFDDDLDDNDGNDGDNSHNQGSSAKSRQEAQGTPSRTAAAPSRSSARSPASVGKSPVEFMKEKADLSKRVRDILASYSSQRSIVRRLQSSIERLTNEQKSELENDPDEILTGMLGAIDELKKSAEGLEKAKAPAWPSKVQAIDSAIAALDSKASAAEEEHEAIVFLLGQAHKDRIARKNAQRYKRTKLANKFTISGYKKITAKRMAGDVEDLLMGKKTIVCALNPSMAEFDNSKLTIWKPDGAAEFLKLFDDATKANLELMKKNLAVKMAENERYSGLMMKVESDMNSLSKLDLWKDDEGAQQLFSERGAHPWLAAMKVFSWRCGPGAFPLVGMGALVRNETELVEFFLYLLPVDAIATKGVALADIQSFLETQVGAEVAESQGRLVRLPRGCVAFVPAGFIVIPVSCKFEAKDDGAADEHGDNNDKEKEADKDKDKDKQKNKDAEVDNGPDIVHFLVLTVFSSKAAKALDILPWAAIEEHNRKYMAKKLEWPAWSHRSEVFEKMVSDLNLKITT